MEGKEAATSWQPRSPMELLSRLSVSSLCCSSLFMMLSMPLGVTPLPERETSDMDILDRFDRALVSLVAPSSPNSLYDMSSRLSLGSTGRGLPEPPRHFVS